MSLIYCVICKCNQKIYIGRTTRTLEIRKREHEALAQKNSKKSSKFHRALKKYGFENFSWKILDRVTEDKDIGTIEASYIDMFGSYFDELGYNMCTDEQGLKATTGKAAWNKGKKGSQIAWNKGMKMDEAFCEKVSKAKQGKTHKSISQEAKNKIGLVHKNKIVSEETRKKQSIARMGKIPWNKNKKTGPAWNKGLKKKDKSLPCSKENTI